MIIYILAIVSTFAGSARSRFRWITGFLVFAIGANPYAEAALTPSNVLVLYNAEDADSIAVANYYAEKRPGVRLRGLNGITTAEEVSANYYLSNIRPQVLPALDESIDVIVTTKGLPLRIRVEQSNPGTYVDPSGTLRSIDSWRWKRYSSLESELTRIDSISSWQQMGDQSTGFTPSPILALNPYYWQNSSFSNSQFGIRLTSRLDGFTVADVQGMIDRAGHAYHAVGSANSPFHFILDDSQNAPGSSADNMERVRDFVLQPRNLPFTYDAGNAFVQLPAVSNPDSSLVIGYVSHGVQGGAPLDYLSNSLDGIQFQLANGAVFASWESLNALTFEPDVPHSQGLVAEWIARGGTAGIGHVAEPLATSYTVAREDCLFDRLLNGMTWVEAAWSATYQLSYVNTVVGDPLMRFQPWIPGDVTMDGAVDMDDLQRLFISWQQQGGFADGDLTGDGLVTFDDFSNMAVNWLRTAPGLAESRNAPEPGSWTLAMIGISLFLGHRRRSLLGNLTNGRKANSCGYFTAM